MQAKMTTWGYLEVVFHDQNSFLYLLPANKHGDSVKKRFLLHKNQIPGINMQNGPQVI